MQERGTTQSGTAQLTDDAMVIGCPAYDHGSDARGTDRLAKPVDSEMPDTPLQAFAGVIAPIQAGTWCQHANRCVQNFRLPISRYR